ncbi:hypothetical protein CB1_001662003 [Camelus ferus]|nr:hypothetical protein CB1_001662003 [Camelus ferus]
MWVVRSSSRQAGRTVEDPKAWMPPGERKLGCALYIPGVRNQPSLVPKVVANAACFLLSALWAGPDSAAKKLTHSWNYSFSIWKEHMLFLLRDESLSSFAEMWPGPSTLMSSNVLYFQAEDAVLCSQV